MSFVPGQATVVTDPAELATYGRAFRKTGKRVALVPLGTGLHAGHIALIRAAKSLMGTVVMVTWTGTPGAGTPDTAAPDTAAPDTATPGAGIPPEFAREGVDVVYHGEFDPAVRIESGLDHLEDGGDVDRRVTRTIAAINATHATDVVVGEKDFEELVALQRAVTELRLEVRLHSLPTVRAANGVAMSLRNAEVPEDLQEAALALSAALTAGAHAAERGGEAVIRTARGVLEAGGVTPDYVELRSTSFGPAPLRGDARLLAAATFGSVRLIDNVGVPVGIGFKNME